MKRGWQVGGRQEVRGKRGDDTLTGLIAFFGIRGWALAKRCLQHEGVTCYDAVLDPERDWKYEMAGMVSIGGRNVVEHEPEKRMEPVGDSF